MTGKDVLFALENTQHAVWQPDSAIELYIPVVTSYSNMPEVLTVPAGHASFPTLKEAWQWHYAEYKAAMAMEHEKIDKQNAVLVQKLEERAGGIARAKYPKPIPVHGNGRKH